MGSRAYSPAKDDPPRQQSEELVARSLIGISELDTRIQEQIASMRASNTFTLYCGESTQTRQAAIGMLGPYAARAGT